ncbi:hypothetical protein FB446DRAFT_817660 [Lentinula raphanica]|nr:hypothetical protein FB446DRAFT_817660 [Lentinula raphanica]
MSLAHRAFAYYARVRRRPSSFWFYFCFNSLLKIILRLLFREARSLFDLPSDVIHFLAFSSPTPLSLVFYTHNSTNDSCTQKSHAHRAPAIRARVEWQPYGNLPPSGSTSVSTPSSSKFPGSISANSPHSLAPTSPISAALCDAEPPKQQHPQSIFLNHLLRPNILVQEISKSPTAVCFGKREVFLIRRTRSFVYLAETPLYASSRKLDTLLASALQTRTAELDLLDQDIFRHITSLPHPNLSLYHPSMFSQISQSSITALCLVVPASSN